MGRSLRKTPSFQLKDIPNKLKKQAKQAGETWMREGAFCSSCKERGTPAIVSIRKDPKDNTNYFFMVCRPCVEAADRKDEEAKQKALTAPLAEMLVRSRQGKSELAAMMQEAQQNIQEGKDEHDKQQAEEQEK